MTITYGLVGSHHLEGGFLERVAQHFAHRAGRRVVLGWSQEPRPQTLEATIVERPAVLLPYRSKSSGGDSLIAGAVVVQMRPNLVWAQCQSNPTEFECVPFTMPEPVKNVYEVLHAPAILPANERIAIDAFTHAGSKNAASAQPKLDVVRQSHGLHPVIDAAFAHAQWLASDSLEKINASRDFESFLVGEPSLDGPTVANRRLEQGILRRLLFGAASTATCAACGACLPVALLWASHVKPRSECTPDERRDFLHNIIPLCKLGCDDTFEQGFWTVDDAGRIQARHGTTPELTKFLQRLAGRPLRHWSPASARYFRERKSGP